MKSKIGIIISWILDVFILTIIGYYGIYENYLAHNFETFLYALIAFSSIIFLIILSAILKFYQTSIIPMLMEIIEPSELSSAGAMITIKFSNKFGSRIFIFDSKCTPSGGCLIANLIGNF